ncbi:MAG: AAA family ATPase [Actinomycetia bacterium]|nr:AAA family ATPase [Actinomycetes bacterium]
MSELRLRLFGAPELSVAGSPITFDTRKALALIAYLAVTGRPQRRESLAALLWPESDQSRARASLRRTLSAAAGVGPALLIGRGEIELDRSESWIDVVEFEALAASDEAISLRRAAELAPDPFLAGFSLRDSAEFDDWSAATSDRLRERLVSVLSRVADIEISAGRLEDAIEVARQWVKLDPLSEGAHRELMRLYTWTGERPTALKQYRQCVRNLDRELGVAPLPETTALYDDIRANRLDAPLRPAATVDQAPPPPPRGAELPLTQTVGTGDADAQALVTAWKSATPDGAGALLVGAPGLGRTTRSAQLRSAVEEAGGGAISLRGHAAELGLAYATILDLTKALSEREPEVADSLAAVGQAVESPGQRVRLFDVVRDAISRALNGPVPGLLVIDDAHWLDPTSSDLLGYLLRRPPLGVLVLATVRSEAFEGSRLDEVATIVTLKEWDAEQTRQALGALNAESIDPSEAFRRTGGNPRLLAEYILASREVGGSPSGQLHELVGTRLNNAPAATRQTLGATAVIGTVADPDLIRQVSGRDEFETVQSLEDAVSRGLLVEDPERHGYDFPHDALRDMVSERIGLARRRLLHGRAADALVRQHSADGGGAPAGRVARHLAFAGREQEAREWYWAAAQQSITLYAHREALEALRSALALGHDPAVNHAATGDALTSLGRYDDAITAYEKAAAATPIDDQNELAVIEHKLAEVHDRLGDWDVARAHLDSAAELLEPRGGLAMRAQVAADLALVSYRQSDPGAEKVGEQALHLAVESGDPVSMSQAKNVLGVLACAKADFDTAVGYLRESKDEAHSAGSTELEVAALNNLARLYAQEGAIDKALGSAQEALELGLAQGDLHRAAALHDHVADLYHRAGHQAAAMEHLKAAAAAFGAVDEARARPEVWKLVSW